MEAETMPTPPKKRGGEANITPAPHTHTHTHKKKGGFRG
jgi:hypothetical protein